MRDDLGRVESELKKVEDELRGALLTLPRMSHPAAPVGVTAADNKVVKRTGTPPVFAFKPKDHYDLVTALDLADLDAGAKVAGQKFYFLKNEGALLELALIQYAMSVLVRDGFTPVITPDLARIEVMEGTGYMPRDPNPETR